MDKSSVPEYLYGDVNFQNYQVFFVNCFSIIPNIYFFYRSLTYKPFNERKVFKYMTMVMSFEFICACMIHIAYNAYLFIYDYLNLKVHLITCSKFNILDLNINQILIVTPFYFNIFRFHKIIFNRNPNIIIILGAIFFTLGPLLYMMGGQYFEINIYYVPKNGCGFQIFSNIPYYQNLVYINLFIVLAVPFVSVIFNYFIYKTAVRRTSKSNRTKMCEYNALFKGISIQSIFPFLCQVPAILYTFYFTMTRKNIYFIEIIINFVYYIGQGFCIFLSMIVIKEFKNMMLRDTGIKKQHSTIPLSTINNRIKSSNFA